MKRLLSVLLSLTLLCNLEVNRVVSGTNFLNKNEAVVYKYKNGESVWIRGKNLPPININNKNKAIANSSSKSKSNSKSSSTSNGGGSGIGQKILLGLALFAGWKACSLKNSIGGGFSAVIGKATGWFQSFRGNNQSGTDQTSRQNGNQGDPGSGSGQGSGQNGTQDSQTNAGAEGSYWGNFSWYDITELIRSGVIKGANCVNHIISKFGPLHTGSKSRALFFQEPFLNGDF